MKYMTIEEIQEIQRLIREKEIQLKHIGDEANEIVKLLQDSKTRPKTMAEIGIYDKRISALVKEKNELKRFIERNKKLVQKFFAPAIVA